MCVCTCVCALCCSATAVASDSFSALSLSSFFASLPSLLSPSPPLPLSLPSARHNAVSTAVPLCPVLRLTSQFKRASSLSPLFPSCSLSPRPRLSFCPVQPHTYNTTHRPPRPHPSRTHTQLARPQSPFPSSLTTQPPPHNPPVPLPAAHPPRGVSAADGRGGGRRNARPPPPQPLHAAQPPLRQRKGQRPSAQLHRVRGLRCRCGHSGAQCRCS